MYKEMNDKYRTKLENFPLENSISRDVFERPQNKFHNETW